MPHHRSDHRRARPELRWQSGDRQAQRGRQSQRVAALRHHIDSHDPDVQGWQDRRPRGRRDAERGIGEVYRSESVGTWLLGCWVVQLFGAQQTNNPTTQHPSSYFPPHKLSTPPSRTTNVSSIRTPIACSGKYRPGSIVMMSPISIRSSFDGSSENDGRSWISRPTPCPSPCT